MTISNLRLQRPSIINNTLHTFNERIIQIRNWPRWRDIPFFPLCKRASWKNIASAKLLPAWRTTLSLSSVYTALESFLYLWATIMRIHRDAKFAMVRARARARERPRKLWNEGDLNKIQISLPSRLWNTALVSESYICTHRIVYVHNYAQFIRSWPRVFD